MKPGEVSGQDYHFISRDQIEKEISANKFIECKEVKGNYYGVHMASVSNVLLSGKSPVLDLQHPQVSHACVCGHVCLVWCAVCVCVCVCVCAHAHMRTCSDTWYWDVWYYVDKNG